MVQHTSYNHSPITLIWKNVNKSLNAHLIPLLSDTLNKYLIMHTILCFAMGILHSSLYINSFCLISLLYVKHVSVLRLFSKFLILLLLTFTVSLDVWQYSYEISNIICHPFSLSDKLQLSSAYINTCNFNTCIITPTNPLVLKFL